MQNKNNVRYQVQYIYLMKKKSAVRLKLQQLSQKSILNKMPLDFIGIAKEYSSVKKQRMMSQQLFDTKNHEMSTIDKINKNLNRNLQKKKKQLEYVQGVRNRYISQSLQKQKEKQIKEIELVQLRNHTIQQRYSSEAKLHESKQKFLQRKKSQCQLTKKQLNQYKSYKLLQQSRLFQKNQSRVKEIEEQKAKIREYYYKFYQNKNRKFMQSYKQGIVKQKNKEQSMKKQMKNLQIKLLLLKQDKQKKQKILNELNSSIDSIRQSRQSFRQSRTRSGCSRTPMQIISGTSTAQNPQKPRFKLIKKQY